MTELQLDDQKQRKTWRHNVFLHDTINVVVDRWKARFQADVQNRKATDRSCFEKVAFGAVFCSTLIRSNGDETAQSPDA